MVVHDQAACQAGPRLKQGAKTRSVERNVAANYLGGAWVALVQLAVLPLYLRYLGMEAYGLIGFYVFLQGLSGLLDLGLTAALSREMARFAGAQQARGVRDLLRSVEILSLGIGLLAFAAIVLAAGWLAEAWLQAERLESATIMRALYLIGVLIALRKLAGVYYGAIRGLQDQVWLNGANAAFATLRAAAGVAVLAALSESIEAFLASQALVALVEVFVLARRSWTRVPSTGRPAFSGAALASVWRFSAGMEAITLLSIPLVHIDSLLLSRMVPLEIFGLFALAKAVAGALNLLVTPVGNVAFPQFAGLLARDDRRGLLDAYHRLSQLLALASAPAAIVLALFAEHVLLLWLRDPAIAAGAAPLVSTLAIAMALYGLMSTPLALQFAHGRTGLIVRLNVASLVLLAPAIYFGIAAHGAIAVGYAWIALNLGWLVFAAPRMMAELPAHERRAWYARDILPPCAAALLPSLLIYAAAPKPAPGALWTSLFVVVAAAASACCAAIAVAPLGRGFFRAMRRGAGP